MTAAPVLSLTLESLTLDIDDATQYATLYDNGRPLATFQRRRVAEKRTVPLWRVFDTSGVLVAVFHLSHAADYMARVVARKLTKGV